MDEEAIRRERDIQKLRSLLLEGAASPLEGEADDAWFEELCQLAARRAVK